MPPKDYKYKAFISYSHQDKKWGDWLHRSLETYRVPKGLVVRTDPVDLGAENMNIFGCRKAAFSVDTGDL